MVRDESQMMNVKKWWIWSEVKSEEWGRVELSGAVATFLASSYVCLQMPLRLSLGNAAEKLYL